MHPQELSHSWFNADRDQEIELTVMVDENGQVESVVDIAIWHLEDGQRRDVDIMDTELFEAAGLIDPMIEQVDWAEKYRLHMIEEAEYRELSQSEE